MRKIAITGGIACGKSLVSKFLDEFGIETIDADDIVHELVPEEERRRLAQTVFKDEQARKALESQLHPLVKARILEHLRKVPEDKICIAVVPLLFEVHWDEEYDIICCVASDREIQISRMMAMRGYTREEAEARLAAQMPVGNKAEKSQYVIVNNGSTEELKKEVERFVLWLKNLMCSQNR